MDLFNDGVTVADMQTGLAISADNKVTGTLHYLDSGSLVSTYGEGYFIALNLTDNDFEGLTSVMVGMDPSVSTGLVEIINDPDKNGGWKVTSLNQKFKIVQTDGEHTRTQTFDLSGLTLEAHESNDNEPAQG